VRAGLQSVRQCLLFRSYAAWVETVAGDACGPMNTLGGRDICTSQPVLPTLGDAARRQAPAASYKA
jgi:hypothetical protein